MPDIQGLGTCSLCGESVDVGQPARYWAGGGHGNVMVHKQCYNERQVLEDSADHKRELVRQKLAAAEARLTLAAQAVERARAELEELDG